MIDLVVYLPSGYVGETSDFIAARHQISALDASVLVIEVAHFYVW